MMRVAQKLTLWAFDIDGTLWLSNGPIARETIERLKPRVHVGICSGRADAWDIAQRLGLGFGMTGKADCLRSFERIWCKPCIGKIYVGDTDLDMNEARKAGWNFVNVNDFKLNLGCGQDIRFGYVNVDVRPLPGVDLVLDLETEPLPFQDNLATEVLAYDVLEHISWRRIVFVLREIHRVLKPGGVLRARLPDVERAFRKGVAGECPPGVDRLLCLSFLLGGGQDYPENVHKSFFTAELFTELLTRLGFEVLELWFDDSNMVVTARKRPR